MAPEWVTPLAPTLYDIVGHAFCTSKVNVDPVGAQVGTLRISGIHKVNVAEAASVSPPVTVTVTSDVIFAGIVISYSFAFPVGVGVNTLV